MTSRSQPAYKILLLEDDSRDAELVTRALHTGQPEHSVLHVKNAARFTRALEEFVPDLVLADHGVPGFSSLDALQLVRQRLPGRPFILVSGFFEQTTADVLKAGADDFVRKSDLSRLIPAIHAAFERREPLRRLSARQVEVLRLLASGDSMREIAGRLALSIKTVETHRAELMRRLAIRDLTGLVRFAIRVGLVRPEP
jgi:DNA-binding NarL/FixJ family response regulator